MRRSGSGIRISARRLDRLPARLGGAHALMHLQRFADLAPDRHEGIEMGRGILKDHGDAARRAALRVRARRAPVCLVPQIRSSRIGCGHCAPAGAISHGRRQSCRNRFHRRCPAPRPGASVKLTPRMAGTGPCAVVERDCQILDGKKGVTGHGEVSSSFARPSAISEKAERQ